MSGAPELRIDPERELSELRLYLGDAFDQTRLERYAHQLHEEFERIGDEQAFYRRSEGYLYDLTAFAMSGTKLPYLADLRRGVPPPARLLDYGCGIGSDGLALLEAGYQVAFADFDNPSTRYLRWRLERRGLEATVHDLDAGAVPAGFDAAYAFDVIEHVADPFAFLGELERRARLVAVNFLAPESGETTLHHELHHELPVAELVAHAAARGLRRYRRYHGRSHFVIYAPGRPGRAGRLRARLALLEGRLASR